MYSIALSSYFRNRYNASNLKIVCKNSHFRYGTICGLRKEMSIQICLQRFQLSFVPPGGRLRPLQKRNLKLEFLMKYLVKVKNMFFAFWFFCFFFFFLTISDIYCENENILIISVSRNSLCFHFRLISEREARAHLAPYAHVSNCRTSNSVRKVRDASMRFLAVLKYRLWLINRQRGSI